MVGKKIQTMRYSDEELALIKRTFADNYELLMAIRKVMLQMTLSGSELAMLLVFKQDDIFNVVSKTLLPELDGDLPFNQNVDLFMMINIENKSNDEALIQISSQDRMIKYFKQQLQSLRGKNDEKIKFEDFSILEGKNQDNAIADIIARNKIVGYTESNLNQLLILAGQKEETVEETVERLKKNSNK